MSKFKIGDRVRLYYTYNTGYPDSSLPKGELINGKMYVQGTVINIHSHLDPPEMEYTIEVEGDSDLWYRSEDELDYVITTVEAWEGLINA